MTKQQISSTPNPRSPLAPLGTVKERNKRYNSMSVVERRKAVALDVIAQLEAKTYEATHGIYVYFPEFHHFCQAVDRTEEVLRDDSVELCQCCARGAIFVSAVRLFDSSPGVSMYDIEDDLFGDNSTQIQLMEKTFEGCHQIPPAEIMKAIMRAILFDPQGQFTNDSHQAIMEWNTSRIT